VESWVAERANELARSFGGKIGGGTSVTRSGVESARGELSPGAKIGPYVVRQRIGVGASGSVYEVQGQRRRYALKLFDPELARKSLTQQRFRREFDVLRRLRHPHIVRCFELGWDSDRETSFLVMELLTDPTLRQFQVQAVRTRGAILHILQQALAGLEAVHRYRVVHRDLKPDNIAVGERARLIDFGLATPAVSRDPRLRNVGFGTPTYMAPEQAAGPVGPTADVWSVGVMLYQAASGRVPFHGTSAYEVLSRSTQEPHPPLEETPAPFEALVDDCLRKRPEDRPAHAGRVRERLQAILTAPGATRWLDEPCVRRPSDPKPTVPDLEAKERVPPTLPSNTDWER